MREVLVTGGAGYVGSHFVKALRDSDVDYRPVVLDNLSKGHRDSVRDNPLLVCDLSNKKRLDDIFKERNIEAVVHFAGSCYVGESVENPHKYYKNNLVSGWNLLHTMLKHNVEHIIFSSSCAVYGEPETLPITEKEDIEPVSPYGKTKRAFEIMLEDYQSAYDFNYVSLRYAAGADPDGEIGEDHNPETHLIPIIIEAALGLRDQIEIYGTDYDTPDGTCVRDYIHVMDLAQGHILALDKLFTEGGGYVYNMGSEDGYSVREMIEAVKKTTGRNIKVVEGTRREGDPPRLVADSSKIKKELDWEPEYSNLDSIIESAWKWHSSKPRGYRK